MKRHDEHDMWLDRANKQYRGRKQVGNGWQEQLDDVAFPISIFHPLLNRGSELHFAHEVTNPNEVVVKLGTEQLSADQLPNVLDRLLSRRQLAEADLIEQNVRKT